jgi:hypothetical protein
MFIPGLPCCPTVRSLGVHALEPGNNDLPGMPTHTRGFALCLTTKELTAGHPGRIAHSVNRPVDEADVMLKEFMYVCCRGGLAAAAAPFVITGHAQPATLLCVCDGGSKVLRLRVWR